MAVVPQSETKEKKMKTLSIIQPWASLIAVGIKDIENRTWRTNYRGEFLIHASAKRLPAGWDALTNGQKEAAKRLICPFGNVNNPKALPISAIIGKATLVDCVQNHPSVWAEKGVWNWVLEDVVLFDRPILNVKGKLGFWEFDNSLLADVKPCVANSVFTSNTHSKNQK